MKQADTMRRRIVSEKEKICGYTCLTILQIVLLQTLHLFFELTFILLPHFSQILCFSHFITTSLIFTHSNINLNTK